MRMKDAMQAEDGRHRPSGDPESLRMAMVEHQIAGRGITDRRVLDAMGKVPREKFVAPGYEAFAYEDRPLPIAGGQTVSQPYVVALMAQAAHIGPEDRLLEVGAGSGYAAAVLARLGRSVHGIERIPELADAARSNLAAAGVHGVDIRQGDGSLGLPEFAPYDAILVAAFGPRIPPALKEQLAPGGRLVMPVGSGFGGQSLIRLHRTETGFEKEDLGPVTFVPLVGRQAWPGSEP